MKTKRRVYKRDALGRTEVPLNGFKAVDRNHADANLTRSGFFKVDSDNYAHPSGAVATLRSVKDYGTWVILISIKD